MHSGGCDKTSRSQRQNAPTPPMSAPGGLARRFWGDASANHMSLREHSAPNIMARHGTLRRATQCAETMRELRQTEQGYFLTNKKVGQFLDTATCRFSVLCSRKKITIVCQHRQALPGNVVDSDARSGRFSVSQNCVVLKGLNFGRPRASTPHRHF